jgi:hypothetical protein
MERNNIVDNILPKLKNFVTLKSLIGLVVISTLSAKVARTAQSTHNFRVRQGGGDFIT